MKQIYKILIIAGVAVLVVAGGYLLWRALSGTGSTPGGDGTTGEGGRLPVSPPTQEPARATSSPIGLSMQRLSEGRVFDFWVNGATGEVYYMAPDGTIFIAKEGPDLDASKQTIEAVNAIEPAPGGRKMLASFGDPTNPRWATFDVVDKVWKPLPAEVKNATWGAKDSEVVVQQVAAGRISLAFLDIAKNPPVAKVILNDFRLNDVRLSFRPPTSLYISERPSSSYLGRIWKLDTKTFSLTLMMDPERSIAVDWSGDASVAFKFSAPPRLAILDANLQPIDDSSFATFPSKCTAASSSTAYCFIPQYYPSAGSAADDYLMGRLFTVDDLGAIAIRTGSFDTLASSNAGSFPAVDAYHPRYANGNLYFINRYDAGLYRVPLGANR